MEYQSKSKTTYYGIWSTRVRVKYRSPLPAPSAPPRSWAHTPASGGGEWPPAAQASVAPPPPQSPPPTPPCSIQHKDNG